MKRIAIAIALLLVGCARTSAAPQVDTTYQPKPSYHTVRAYVSEVDTDEWYGYCGDFIGNAVYGFEILDEFNVGDNVRVVVCDNATPLIRYDDYVVQVHYGW